MTATKSSLDRPINSAACLAVLAAWLMLAGLINAPAHGQVLTVPDDETVRIIGPLPPAPPVNIACEKGQICTVCVAGCPASAPNVVYQRQRPVLRRKTAAELNAQLNGLNRHPGSIILCGPEGTCRGLGRPPHHRRDHHHHEHGHIAYYRYIW